MSQFREKEVLAYGERQVSLISFGNRPFCLREGSQVTLALTGRSVLPFFPLRLVPSPRVHDVVRDVQFPVHTKSVKRGDNHGFP